MGLQIKEAWKSGEGSIGRDGQDTYIAIVDSNAADPATDYADDPVTVSLYALQHFAAISAMGNPISNVARERIAPFTWKFTATFLSPTTERTTNDASFSFTTGGGTQKITQSIRTVMSYKDLTLPISFIPPDYKGAIGVNDDKEVDGTEIHVRTFDFRITFYLSPSAMSAAYLQIIKSLSSHVNSDPVMLNIDGVQLTFQPGELLYLNGDGSKRKGFTDWEFTLNFSHTPNVRGAKVGGIEGIDKDGWDYIWFLYQKQVDAGVGALLPRPVAAYVEQVYDRAALTPLIKQTTFGLSNTLFWLNPGIYTGGGFVP